MSQNLNVKSELTNVNDQLYRSYGTSTDEDARQKKNSVDLLQATIGDFGRWQCRISLLMSLLKFPIAWFQLGIVFLAPPTEFWCKPPDEYTNMSVNEWKEFIAPRVNDYKVRYSTLESGSCMMRDITKPESNNAIMPCLWGYDYNRSIVNSNIITEWDLVCGRERLVDVAQITLMFGVLLGSILFGVAADRFGRRKVLIFSIFLQSICGTLSALSPWYLLFLVLRFFLALANGGTMITSFVMCMEVVGGPWRTIVPILYQIPFGIGNSVMAAVAYFERDWRELQFTLSALSAVYIVYYWLVPESPRWLLAVGRKEEAVEILENAAEINGMKKTVVMRALEETNYSSINMPKENLGLPALVRTVQLRKRTILLCFNWLISGVSFYGFSQYLGQISQNLYFAVAAGGLISVPGTILCVLVVKRCGRRTSIACANSFTGICFLAILMVPRGVFYQDWPRVFLAGCGVIGISVSLPALYLFTGELFPTVLRNAGVGTTVMCSKLGSMLAPLIISLGGLAWFVPLLIFGCLSAVEAVLVLPLPETLNTNLPESIMDIEGTPLTTVNTNVQDGNYILSSKPSLSKK